MLIDWRGPESALHRDDKVSFISAEGKVPRAQVGRCDCGIKGLYV